MIIDDPWTFPRLVQGDAQACEAREDHVGDAHDQRSRPAHEGDLQLRGIHALCQLDLEVWQGHMASYFTQ